MDVRHPESAGVSLGGTVKVSGGSGVVTVGAVLSSERATEATLDDLATRLAPIACVPGCSNCRREVQRLRAST